MAMWGGRNKTTRVDITGKEPQYTTGIGRGKGATGPVRAPRKIAFMQAQMVKGVEPGKGGGPFSRVEYRDLRPGEKGAFKLNEERAKDARNWEYWYKREHGTKSVGGTSSFWQGGKGGEYRKVSRQQMAINAAQKEAERQGQEVWEIEQIQAETAAIEAANARRRRAAIEGKRFSSLRAAEALGAAKQSAARRQASLGEGAGGEGSGLFGTKTAKELRARKVV